MNDLLAKLLPEEGFLRLDPAWKYKVITGNAHLDRVDKLYVKPTNRVKKKTIIFFSFMFLLIIVIL